MGWPFDEPTWNVVEGGYYVGLGSEMLWMIVSIGCLVAALVVGAKHELDAYKKAGNGK